MASNAERIIEQWENFSFWSNKGDKLRINEDGVITDTGTQIGYILDDISELEDDNGCSEHYQFLVLTAQNFKSQPSWKKHKKQLAKAANDAGFKVVFVPQLDIGFGEAEYRYTKADIEKLLLETASYSPFDYKTSVLATRTIIDLMNTTACEVIFAICYNQEVCGEVIHAEKILTEFIRAKELEVDKYIMILEPCADCLKEMLKTGADNIMYYVNHKSKWDTAEYIQLRNDISNRQITVRTYYPIKMFKVKEPKIEKQFNKWKEDYEK